MDLPKSERMTLIHLLLNSLNDDGVQLTELQMNEVHRRLTEYESGAVKAIPVENVMSKLYERFTPSEELNKQCIEAVEDVQNGNFYTVEEARKMSGM